jgi:hypothetical protein
VLLECIVFFSLLFSPFPKSDIKPKAPVGTSPQDSTYVTQTWQEYINQVGLKKAYTDFKNAYTYFPPYSQHVAMHIMGKLLYKNAGNQGITVCDRFGADACYHGFFGEAVQDQGLSKIHAMDAACIKKWGPTKSECQHGIGHGIMSYLGNDKLLEALNACETLQYPSKLDGCKLGVFMEYNFSTVTHDTDPRPRPFTPSTPLEPCASLPETFQYSCYYAQPDWWHRVNHNDFKQIGEFCDMLNEENKKICFLGSGIGAAESTIFVIKQTIKECDEITSSYGSMLCKAGARFQYKVSGQHLKTLNNLCNYSTPSFKKECIENSTFF